MSKVTSGTRGIARDRRPHYVYQFWSARKECLYVGMTASFSSRLLAHQSKAPWWRQVDHFSVEVHPDRECARMAEEEEIRRLDPTYNFYDASVADGCRTGAESGGMNWRKADVVPDA